MRADAAGITLALLPAEEALANPEICQEWNALLSGVHHLNRLFASPIWFEHLWRTDHGAELRLATMRNGSGRLIGVCPIAVRGVPLAYDVASRVLARTTLRAAVLLGGEPMLPPRPEVHHRFLNGLLDIMPSLQCAYISSLPMEGFAGEFFQGTGRVSDQYISYLPGMDRPWYWIELGNSLEQCLGTMSGKSRYNLRRQVRDLRKHAGGSLELLQVDSEDQVGEFLEWASRVSARSWQHRVLGQRIGMDAAHLAKLRDLTRHGILRSFLLKCGPEPCAFVIGYQFGGVYHYEEIGFDAAVGHLSPGTTLLYLILEELFKRNPPTLFNFGIGDASYKRRFANRESRDMSAILFRRGLGNRLRRKSHQAFNIGVSLAKSLLRRRVSNEERCPVS